MTTRTGAGLKGGGDDSDPLLQIALIYNVVDELPRGEARELIADQEVAHTAEEIGAALRSLGHSVDLVPVRVLEDLPPALASYDPKRTLVFNLCENIGGVAREEPRIAQLLQGMGFRYTGSPPHTLEICLDKGRAKRILAAHGVPTAVFQVCRTLRGLRFGQRVPFPAIVKPLAEDGSAGIHRDSVVTSPEALRRQVSYVIDTYRQPALVEAYIPGREFNVSVWGNAAPWVLPLSELDFGDWPELTRFCHFAAKWEVDAPEYTTSVVRCPAEVDPDTAEQIRDVGLRAYTTLGCRGYARVDMRVEDGVPYVLEVNPNPCLAMDAGFARAAGVAGFSYAGMLGQIVRWAWQRPRRTRPALLERVWQPRTAS